MESTRAPKAHKFTLNLDNKKKEIRNKKYFFTNSKIIGAFNLPKHIQQRHQRKSF
jgi:hypothetical protein